MLRKNLHLQSSEKWGRGVFSSVGKSIGNILKRSESLEKGVGGKRY